MPCFFYYFGVQRHMTWDEGLRYVAAERSHRQMKEDAVTNTTSLRHPPKIPEPYDGRMSGLSHSFDEFITSHDEDETKARSNIEDRGVSSKRSSTRSSEMTFEDWIASSRNLNLYELSSAKERRSIRRRLQDPNCRFRQAIAEEPTSAFVFGIVLSIVVGITLGMSISSSLRPTSFRGPPAQKHTTSVENPFRSSTVVAPSRVQRNTVDKVLGFLN